MPSGRTHDAVTILLAAPAFVVTYIVTQQISSASILAAAFVFSGLMFGPDLDTASRQYSRWSVFRPIWLPYRAVFKHRSRFSHGLIFGALIRIIYFKAILAILVFGAIFLLAWFSGGHIPGVAELADTWRSIGKSLGSTLGGHLLLLTFIGLWLGAASHTFTDMAGSFIKTGRVADFL